jgi:hypothetical protein
MKLFKYPNHRNVSYLTWLRSQNCAASGQKAEVAHHMRLGTNGGSALKPSDYFCLPLTEEYHTQGSMAVHLIGEESFVELYQLDLLELFNYYLSNYIEFKTEERIKFSASMNLESRLNLLVDKVESFNTTGTKPRILKKKSSNKQTSKTSITENEFYQRAKELKKVSDKKIRAEKPKVSETEYYQNAKKLNKEYAKKIRDENKERQSEYRKEMYQKAKLYKKGLIKKK